jgi:hypothetical protein
LIGCVKNEGGADPKVKKLTFLNYFSLPAARWNYFLFMSIFTIAIVKIDIRIKKLTALPERPVKIFNCLSLLRRNLKTKKFNKDPRKQQRMTFSG